MYFVNLLKGLWESPKFKVAFVALVGATVEHFTGALSGVLSLVGK